MKNWIVVATLGVGLMGGTLRAQEDEGNAKATRYHSFLLKRPESAILFERFVGAWLDTGTKEGLLAFLKEGAEGGGAVEWRLLAAYLEYGGQDEEALAALNAAVEKDGRDGRLRITRAKLQARLLNFEGALADLEAAGPDAKEGDDAALRGLYLARSGRPEEAVKAWKEVMKARPMDEELREDLIELEVAEGLYEEALETADGLLAITKDAYLKALRRLRKGDILVVAGKREDALKVFEEVLASTGDNSWLEREVLAQVERVFVREDDLVGLRKFYDQLREAFPRRVSLRKGLAIQMVANGETEEAVALFREVLKITPGDRRNRAEFIDLLESADLVGEAVKELRALMGKKDDAELLERLAGLEDQRKNKEGVLEAMGKVLVLRGDDAFGMIRVARLYDRFKFEAEAEKVLRDGHAKFPDTLEMTESLATFLVQSKRRDEALELWLDLAKMGGREGLMRVARSLSANGMPKEAFKVMDARVKEFGRDPLLLAQYCQAATYVDEAEKAWPYAVILVRNADTSTALEGALKVSVLMARRLDAEALIRELKDSKSVGERCLLSELYEMTGEDVVALEILTKAEESDEGLLVAAQRVRLLERRGDLDLAAAAMRELLERPKGRRPVFMRRLVDLLGSAGKLEEALAEVEAWKRMAPGDRVAWRRRSELLREMGRIDEAVVELRRAASKFGRDDEEMRGRLAGALVEAGDYREGERIYNKLYEEAESTGGKLKWIVEMVNLARQEGRQDELVEDFERRKRANPREVTPLLALAEIYRLLEDPMGQEEALVEAVRRRPGDVKLIGDLAKVAERSGDLDKALKWRVEAAKRDPGPDSKRRLADYYFRNGETELGLAQLKSIPAEGKNPRAIEKTLQALAKTGEWRIMLSYATELAGVVNGDWRLRYLHAVALEQESRNEEAREIFRELLVAEGELPGARPLQELKQFRLWAAQNTRRAGGQEKTLLANYQWSHYRGHAYRYVQNRRSRSVVGMDPIAMPGELRELRWMALAHVAVLLADLEDEERAQIVEAIRAPWMEVADLDSIGQKDLPKYFTEKLEKNPDDQRLLARAVERVGENEKFDVKWIERAATTLGRDRPMVALQARFILVRRSGKEIGSQTAELLKLVDEVDEGTKSMALAHLAQMTFGNETKLTSEQEAQVADRIEEYLSKVEDSFWGQNWWLSSYLNYRLVAGDYEKAISLMNRISAAVKREQKKQGGAQIGSVNYRGYQQPRSGLRPPQFPGSRLSARIHQHFQRLFGEQYVGAKTPKLTPRHKELLAQLEQGQVKAARTIDREALANHLGGLEDDYLRVMLSWYCGKKEETGALLAAMAEQGEADAIVMAAGYAASQEKDQVKAYDLLVKARSKLLERQVRREIDGYIALLGSNLASREETREKVNLEEAKRAAMRLRRSFRGNSEVQLLAQVMGTLGMQAEMERLLNPRSTRVRVGGASQFGSRSSRQRNAGVAKFLSMGNRKGAALEAAKEVRNALRSSYNSDYEFRQVIELVTGAQLGDEVLGLLDPRDSKSVSRRLTYARACIGMKKPELALEVLRPLAKERPKDAEVRSMLASVLPAEERTAALKHLVAEESLEEAGKLIFAMFSSAREEEDMHLVMELLAELLEMIEPSGEAERNLSFAPYFGRHAVEPWRVNNVALPGLSAALKIPEKKLESEDEDVQKAIKQQQEQWARRQKVATRLLKAMLRHPQTAKPGFQLMYGNRIGLDREADSFLEEAKAAIRTQVKWKDKGQRRSQPWTYYTSRGGSGSGTPSSAGLEPMAYLLQYGAGDEKKFNEELLDLMREAEPEKKALLDVLTAVVSGEEDKEMAAMKLWRESLPEATRSRGPKLMEAAKFLLMLDLKDGMVMKEIEGLLLEGEIVLQYARSSAKLYQSLGEWARKHRGREGLHEVFAKITEGMIGKRETWPAYLELSQAGVLPQNFRRGEYSLESFFEIMVQSDAICLESLAFVARYGLAPIAEDVRYYYSQGLRGQLNCESPEEYIEKLAQAGLWDEDSFGIWGALFDENKSFGTMVFEQVNLKGATSQEARKKIGKALEEATGEGSFLKHMAAASVLRDDSSRDLVIAALHREAARLKALPEDQREGLGVMVRRWIPEMEIEGADEDVSALLADLNKGGKGHRVEEAMAWLENGFGENNGRLSDRVAIVIADVVKDDRSMAAKLWISYLKHVREESLVGGRGRSYSGNLLREAVDYNQDQMFEGLVSRRTATEDWLAMLIALERSEEAEYLAGGGDSYYLNNLMEMAMTALIPGRNQAGSRQDWFFWLKKQWEGLADLPGKDAGEEERGIAASYIGVHLWNQQTILDTDKMLHWLDESKFMERRPFFGRVFRIHAIMRRKSGEIPDEQKEEAKKLLGELLFDERIPVRMRVMLAQQAASTQNPKWLLDSAESASAVVKLLDRYHNGKRQVVSTPTAMMLQRLSDLESGPRPAECKVILERYESALFGPMAMRSYRGGKGRELFARPMMILAVRAQDPGAARRMAAIGGELMKGDLALLLRLAKHGEEELVGRLLAPPGKLYAGMTVGTYDEDLATGWKVLEKMIPDEKRYRIACLIASAPDSEAWKEGEGPKRSERLLELAKSFHERAPKIRMARLQCLGAIAHDNVASAQLEKELSLETQRWMYGQGLNRSASPELKSAQLVILQAMRMSGEKGEISELKRQVMPLLDLATTNTNQAYQATSMLAKMGKVVTVALLKGLGDHPEKVDEALPYAREVFEKCLRTREYYGGVITQLAVAQAILVHALAGKGTEFDEMVEKLTPSMRKRYDAIRKQGMRGVLGIISQGSSSAWLDEKNARARVVLLQALLMDEASAKRELESLSDIYQLAGYKTFSYDDIAGALREMPAERPEWKALGGNLAMLLRLAEKGEVELIGKLLPEDDQYYRNDSIGSYDEELQKNAEALLTAVEESRRYRIECLIAGCVNSKKYADEVKNSDTQGQRLEKLAHQFSERAPQDGAAREQCLEVLGRKPAAKDLLQEEFIKISGDWDFGAASGPKAQPTQRERARRMIYRRGLLYELAEGKTERAKGQLLALFKAAQNEDKKKAKAALTTAGELSISVARGYLFGMAANPEAGDLAFAREIFDASLALPGKKDQPKKHAEVMMVLGYALAGKGNELSELVASWPEEKKEAWGEIRKDLGIKMFSVIGKGGWIIPARREHRKAVLRALISDPGTAAREFRHLTNLTSLMDGGVVLRDEIYEVVQSLPADHPRRVECLTEIAGIMAWREQRIEDAMKIYAQAEAAALADGDEAMLSLTRAYHARCLAQIASDQVKAWEWASKVEVAKLPERDRKWFRKESPKWKKAAGE